MGGVQLNILYPNDTIIINKQKYTVLKKRGEGSFGKVYVIKRNSDGMKFILKITENNYHGKNELDIMKRLSFYPDCNPCIVCLYDYEIAKDFIYLLMEYKIGSDMEEFLNNYKVKLYKRKFFIVKDLELFNKWFYQAIAGLCYMHKLGIIHLDIKPRNILIDLNRDLKFIDFGLSTQYKKDKFIDSFNGTECYNEPYLNSACFYTDIYALGVTFTSMFLKPTADLCNTSLISNVIDTIQFPSKYKYYKTLLREMTKVTKDRPSAQEILDFLKSNGTKPLVIEDYKKC